MSYENTNGFIVIAEDNRDPDQSWQAHLNRGSAGGVDCVASMRTPLVAPMDCHVSSYWGGTGGNTIHMDAADGSGWADEFMHADEAPITGFVPMGGFVGYSGDSGGDYAPHVHWHRIDPSGQRQNPWHYFTGGGGSPTGTTNGEGIMRYKATSASKDGLIRDGDSFLQGAEGPLRLIGLDEANAYEYNDQTGRPTPYAEWSGNALRDLVALAGLRAYDGAGRPTGDVVY
jgi:hypothetical protein